MNDRAPTPWTVRSVSWWDRSALAGPGAELLVFEADGGAYAAVVADDMVMQSGDPAWVGADDGCPV